MTRWSTVSCLVSLLMALPGASMQDQGGGVDAAAGRFRAGVAELEREGNLSPEAMEGAAREAAGPLDLDALTPGEIARLEVVRMVRLLAPHEDWLERVRAHASDPDAKGAAAAVLLAYWELSSSPEMEVNVGLVRRALTHPRLAEAAGISPWGTTIIAGLHAEGKVWTVWFSKLRPQDRWQARPLTKIAKAGSVVGNLSIYFTSWNGINVAGLTETGETSVIWWVPRFKGKWEVVNPTDKFDGPTFKTNSMTTYATPWNALTIVGITQDNRMVAYWWAPGFTKWAIADFSELLPNNQPRVIRGPIHYDLRANNNI